MAMDGDLFVALMMMMLRAAPSGLRELPLVLLVVAVVVAVRLLLPLVWPTRMLLPSEY